MYLEKKKTHRILILFFMSLLIGMLPHIAKANPIEDPTDDEFEDNDDFESAANITLGMYQLIAADVDVFRIELNQTQLLKITFTINDWYDLGITIYDQNENWQVNSYIYNPTEKNIVYYNAVNNHSAYVYLEPLYYDGEESGIIRYNMTIEIIEGYDPYLDDEYEDNDVQQLAKTITESSYSNLIISGMDNTDFYKIYIPEDTIMKLNISFMNYQSVYLNVYSESYEYSRYFYFKENTSRLLYFKETGLYYLRFYTYFPSKYHRLEYNFSIDFENALNPAKYSYGVENGRPYNFNIETGIEFDASKNFYSEWTDYLKSMEDYQGNKHYKDDFSAKEYYNTLSTIFSDTIQVEYYISDIFNIHTNAYFDNFIDLEDFSSDIIRGDISFENYETPADFYLEKIMEYKTYLKEVYTDDYYDESYIIHDLNYDESKLQDLNLETFQDNLIEHFLVIDEFVIGNLTGLDLQLNDGTKLPLPSINTYVPTTIFRNLFENPDQLRFSSTFVNVMGMLITEPSICFPEDFNFDLYYNWLNDVLDFMQIYLQEQEIISNITDIYNYDMDSLLYGVGIESRFIDDYHIGLTWNYESIDFTFLTNLLEDIYGVEYDESLEELIAVLLLNQGIDANKSSAEISISLEYDSNMVLISSTIYFEISAYFDYTQAELDDPPEVIDEEFIIRGFYTFSRDGYYPPSESQIRSGELGYLRDYTKPPKVPFFEGIPGYNLSLFTIVGMISLLGLIISIKYSRYH